MTAAIAQGVARSSHPGAVALICRRDRFGIADRCLSVCRILPAKQQARRARLEELQTVRTTLVIYEAPHRIRETLADALDVLGNRQASLARELTKLFAEQFVRARRASGRFAGAFCRARTT
ncbi:MAG: hypothetical protein U0X75_23010 [Acidobacteriota bacterium]